MAIFGRVKQEVNCRLVCDDNLLPRGFWLVAFGGRRILFVKNDLSIFRGHVVVSQAAPTVKILQSSNQLKVSASRKGCLEAKTHAPGCTVFVPRVF